MRIIFISVFFAFLFYTSCRTDLAEGPIVIQPNSYAHGFSDEWYEDVEYIPLSSKGNENYLYGALKVLLTDNHVFVLQDVNTERSIFKFDRMGTLLKSLKGSNNLQKTFYSVSDLDLFDGKIVLTDAYLNEISFFNQELEFINSISVPEGGVGVQNITFLNENTLLVRPDLEKSPLSSVLKSNLNTSLELEMIDDFVGVKNTIAKGMRFSFYETFHHANESGKILYTDFFEDKIYEISPAEAEEKYQLLLDEDLWFTKEEMIDMNSMDLDEQFNFRGKKEKVSWIDAVHENEDQLMLSFMKVMKRYLIFLDRDTREVEAVLLDFNKNALKTPDGSPPLKYFLGFTDAGDLIFYHLAEEFSQYAESLKNEKQVNYSTGQKKFLVAGEKTDEYCNIVLSIFKRNNIISSR